MRGAGRPAAYRLLSKGSYVATLLIITISETWAGLDKHGESTVTLFNEAIQWHSQVKKVACDNKLVNSYHLFMVRILKRIPLRQSVCQGKESLYSRVMLTEKKITS